MVKTLPDKYIRKAIYTAINNISVSTFDIPCYDRRVTIKSGQPAPQFYVLMSSQSNEVDKSNKCAYQWESQILLDIVTSYDLSGNTGSRLMADDILDAVRAATDNLTLDVGSGLEILSQKQSFPGDLETENGQEIIYRKFIRIEFLIN